MYDKMWWELKKELKSNEKIIELMESIEMKYDNRYLCIVDRFSNITKGFKYKVID